MSISGFSGRVFKMIEKKLMCVLQCLAFSELTGSVTSASEVLCAQRLCEHSGWVAEAEISLKPRANSFSWPLTIRISDGS